MKAIYKMFLGNVTLGLLFGLAIEASSLATEPASTGQTGETPASCVAKSDSKVKTSNGEANEGKSTDDSKKSESTAGSAK